MKRFLKVIFVPLSILVILITRVYRLFISPILPNACRFRPTCSEYMLEAIRMHGVVGVFLGIRRILRCHPWGGSGVDPVSEVKKGR